MEAIMANPYDDVFNSVVSGGDSSVSPYDELWAQTAPKQQNKKARTPDALDSPNPTDGMSGTQKFLAGYGKSVADLARGIGQYTPFVSRKDVEESRRLDAPLMKTGAGIGGNIVGGMANLAPTAMIPGANTITGAGVLGAVTGAFQPSASTEETLGNVGFGALGGMAIPTAIRAGQVAKSFVEPFYQSGRDQIIGRVFRDVAGNQADDAARNLTGASSIVPGSIPTAGEVAKNPGIAALQRTAVATDPVAMNEMALRQVANNQARISALQTLIGDKNISVSAREAAVKALYDQANGKAITLTPELESLLKRPVMQSAITEARTLAANEGRPFGLSAGTSSQPSSVLGANGLPVSTVPGTPGTLRGVDAHTLKRSLDDTIEGFAGQNGLAKNAKRAAGDTRAAFLNQIEQQLPEYRQARETFAKLSRPINQSDVAELLLERSTGGIQGNMTPAAFNRSLSDRTAQSALGRKGATLENTFDAPQLSLLNNIKTDLKNLDYANSAGKGPGSDTIQKLAFSNMLRSAGLPNAVQSFAPLSIMGNVAQKFGNIAYSDANKKMSEQLARSMLDPKTVAELMKSGVTPKGLLDLENLVSRLGIPVTGGLLGASNWAQ